MRSVVGLGVIAATQIAITRATPATAYSTKDAGYVTNSRDPAVLDYIVCLEAGVRQAGRISIDVAIRRAEKKCERQAKLLSDTQKDPNAEDIRMMILACGFRAGDGSPDMGC